MSASDADALARIADLRLQIDWIDGDRTAAPAWTFPSGQRWQPGDAPAVLVSELDAPWRRVPVSTLARSDVDDIEEAWFMYAWGLDHADSALYATCFTEDASALLPPMGDLQGRRVLMAALKAFRMPWPWIQHAGEALDVELDSDGQGATLVLGRVIPGRLRGDDGKPLFGAHYRIRMARSALQWQIARMEYRTGWFTTAPADD